MYRVAARDLLFLLPAAAALLFLGHKPSAAPFVQAPGPRLSWWVTHATVKIRPQDSMPPEARKAAVLHAARNEFESFQIVLRADGGNAAKVDAVASPLTGPDGASIASENILLYREEFLNLRKPSSVEGAAGEWPDPLIPRVDRYAGERRNGFPFSVTAGRAQPLWIEVYVPPDTPPGDYQGEIRIPADGGFTATVPVNMHVWNFTLASTSTLRNTFGLSGLSVLKQHRGGYTNDDDLRALTYLYQKAALWHRLSTHGGTVIPPRFEEQSGRLKVEWTDYDREMGPFLDGTVFAAGDPLPGAKVTATELRTPGGADTDEKKKLYWKEWVRHFQERGWLNRLFHYVWDEPSAADVVRVAAAADLARQADARLHNLVTTSLNSTLQPLIDIWTPVINCADPKPGFDSPCWNPAPLADHMAAVSRGNAVWWYQSCMSHGCEVVGGEYFRGWPSYVIDVDATANRILPWLSWKNNIGGELYYSMTEAFSKKSDPWTDVYLFGGNGDGTLFYPGRPDRIGGRTDIPIESIRLKLIREGLEDYEYLSLLARLGQSKWAGEQAGRLVRAAYDWQRAPEDLYDIRQALGERLSELAPSDAGRVP